MVPSLLIWWSQDNIEVHPTNHGSSSFPCVYWTKNKTVLHVFCLTTHGLADEAVFLYFTSAKYAWILLCLVTGKFEFELL
jgi:hypothetical protein